ANPYLAGQNEAYLANALAEWKNGTRHNDASGQMTAIAKQLTEAGANAIVAVPGARASAPSGPTAATVPHQGVGTQQGSSLMGGSQGQGSGSAGTNSDKGT